MSVSHICCILVPSNAAWSTSDTRSEASNHRNGERGLWLLGVQNLLKVLLHAYNVSGGLNSASFVRSRTPWIEFWDASLECWIVFTTEKSEVLKKIVQW